MLPCRGSQKLLLGDLGLTNNYFVSADPPVERVDPSAFPPFIHSCGPDVQNVQTSEPQGGGLPPPLPPRGSPPITFGKQCVVYLMDYDMVITFGEHDGFEGFGCT